MAIGEAARKPEMMPTLTGVFCWTRKQRHPSGVVLHSAGHVSSDTNLVPGYQVLSFVLQCPRLPFCRVRLTYRTSWRPKDRLLRAVFGVEQSCASTQHSSIRVFS